MLSPWSCQSPLSAVRVHTYSHHDLVRGFSCYRPGPVRAYRQLSESARIVAVILSEVSHTIALISNNPSFRLKHPGVPDSSDGSGGTSYPLTEN